MEEVRKVPKMRFKEFEGEWEEKKLGEVAEFYTTNSYSRECLNYEKGNIRNIHYGDIHTKFNTLLDLNKINLPYINENITNINTNFFCKDGDLIIADASEDYKDIGKSIEIINISNQKVVSGLHTIHLRENTNSTSIGFKGYIFATENIRKQIKFLATGSKVLGISKTNLKTLSLNLPTLPEQTKIANFLTLIDDKIELEQQKLDNYTQYKKGMLQQIFNKTLRFKDDDGREFGEWVEVKLGDCVEESKQRNTNLNENKILSVTASKGLVLQSEHFSKVVASKEIKNYKIIYKNQIGYNPARINVGSIAMLSNFESGILSPMYVVFICKLNTSSTFLIKYLKSDKFINIIPTLTEGSVRDVLSFRILQSIPILLPTLPEQTKIANFLTLIDDKLELQQQKVAQLNLYKKALLQQMFV